MAGIYIHIPFCRQKCYYCDFYKTVNTSLTGNFIAALKLEIQQRKNYLENERIGDHWQFRLKAVIQSDRFRPPITDKASHFIHLNIRSSDDSMKMAQWKKIKPLN